MTESAAIHRTVPASGDLGLLVSEVEKVFHGKREVVKLALAALLARGHILFEDVPGVGKTTLSHALARTLGLSFRRIQFTSDLLPSDVLGGNVYDPSTGTLDLRPGPIFSQVILADEINRAPPRTQSGLLQAMQEGTVTIEDRTLELPRPFLVMATQNPLEHHGTYPLPESQLDRFLMRLTIGYPDEKAERLILTESARSRIPLQDLRPVFSPEDVLRLQAQVEEVTADESVVDYLMEIVRRTREAPGIRVGVSPRGAIALFRASRAYALTMGRDYLVPDDVRDLVHPCLAHRIHPVGASPASAEAHRVAESLLDEILGAVEVPV
ncbi:MAG: MoxR family ATPase [Gemmatimonadales bacterium]|jgi:MoxR-like ATPase|nr:MAG: MoxR family ATPase [Gemmatimonadales bacterium]